MARRIDNPILNTPFDEPNRHFRFDSEGITDDVVETRRSSQYTVPVPPKKTKGGAQLELSFTEVPEDRIEENRLVNLLRDEIARWRLQGYQGATATSKRVLAYWRDPERERPLFFCQVEAIETAIYLAEAADKNSQGRYVLNELRRFADDANPGLFRVAHKMATGTGKTVVMAMLIAWHTLNKAANPQSRVHTDAFLVVCPGITIRDRLRVLLPSDPDNYYRQRDLVPPELAGDLSRAQVVITNFHALRPRETVRAPAVTKAMLGAEAGVFTERPDQIVRRVCRELLGKRNIVVLNDEAHHCYRRRVGTPEDVLDKLKGDDRKEAARREDEARVWISGIEAVAGKLGVRTVYDLSATPFFLRGSGYPEGTLFPWVASDFGLIDAIEAGLVKIPRVPVDDDAAQPSGALPTYRDLWPRVRDKLPKATTRRTLATTDLSLGAAELEAALVSLYGNYRRSFERWRETTTDVAGTTPPVFIVVCNNTAVSKLVFDWIAGHEREQPTGERVLVPGHLKEFSNVVDQRLLPRARTILIDSVQLDSGDAMSDEFKRLAAAEIAEFKAEYEQRFPGRSADDLDDTDLLREVMNTVGKPGRLGENVRCVVSVSMLTEGWDANTVTHILGVRAFGTQLLCEQVVGRGLRRMSYAVDPDTGHFTPEYAEVYGIPFSFIPASGAVTFTARPKPVTRVRALRERASKELTFPRVIGYRADVTDALMEPNFDADSVLELRSQHVPTTTEMAGWVGLSDVHTLDDLRQVRTHQVAFEITRQLLGRFASATNPDDPNDQPQPKPWLFPKLLSIVRQWMADPSLLRLHDGTFPQLLMLAEWREAAVERVYRGIVRAGPGFARLKPILRPWDPTGSTATVDFQTTREVWPTDPDKSHVDGVALDRDWEKHVAQVLETVSEVDAYVKNQGLGFTIPYVLDSQQHQYVPDFLVRLRLGPSTVLNVILEVSGRPSKEKAAKVATARTQWVPAINEHGGFGEWAFLEVTDPWNFLTTLLALVSGDRTLIEPQRDDILFDSLAPPVTSISLDELLERARSLWPADATTIDLTAAIRAEREERSR